MKIGITLGDINGISPEVIIKTLSDIRVYKSFTPIIYGSYKVLSYHKNYIKDCPIQFVSITDCKQAHPNKINVINCWDENSTITIGKPSADSGKFAKLALDRAMVDIKSKDLSAIVTAPINKYAMQLANFGFPGHTEYLTFQDQAKSSLMLMSSQDLRVAVVTNHEPVAKIASLLTKDLILEKVKVLHKTLVQDFGIEKPIISVLGLNPHASDDSVIGNEEEKIITPAILEAKKQGILATGPYPADAFFGGNGWKKTDAVLAMYHDQGLIPFKTIAFGGGTNVTCGLSFIRTSPDHGTAYDIAGQGIADESSFRNAMFTAVDLVRQRKDYFDSKANALVRREKQSAGIHE